MTLHEFLKVCCKDDYVGLYDMDTSPLDKYKSRKRFEVFPTEQSYFKIDNIPYGRIRYFLDKEICAINHTEKGYLVRIHTAGRATKSLEQMRLAREIAKAIKEGG